MNPVRVLLVVWIAVLVAACEASPTPSPFETVALPTLASDIGGCRGVGLEATLVGDPADPRVTWLIDDNGRRRELIWPPGYVARFTPRLQVIGASGVVVFVAGHRIEGGCTAGGLDDPGRLLVLRPGF